jgi:hypothetical protein
MSDDIDRDEHLCAALRHAPDADVRPGELTKARVLAAARRATQTQTPPRRWWWAPRWGLGTAFAALLAATVLWVGRDDLPQDDVDAPPAATPVPSPSPPAPAPVPPAANETAAPPAPVAERERRAAPPRPAAPARPATQAPAAVPPPAGVRAEDAAPAAKAAGSREALLAPAPSPSTSPPPAAPPAAAQGAEPAAAPAAATAAAPAAPSARAERSAPAARLSAATAPSPLAGPAAAALAWSVDGGPPVALPAGWLEEIDRTLAGRWRAAGRTAEASAAAASGRALRSSAGTLVLGPDAVLWCDVRSACLAAAAEGAQLRAWIERLPVR